MVYLSTSQYIFEVQYGLGDDFPLIFASLAVGVGFATYLNGVFVVRVGMKRIALVSLISYTLSSFIYVFMFLNKENPPLWILLIFFALQFTCRRIFIWKPQSLSHATYWTYCWGWCCHQWIYFYSDGCINC